MYYNGKEWRAVTPTRTYKDSQLAYWDELLERGDPEDLQDEFSLVVQRLGIRRLTRLALDAENSTP